MSPGGPYPGAYPDPRPAPHKCLGTGNQPRHSAHAQPDAFATRPSAPPPNSRPACSSFGTSAIWLRPLVAQSTIVGNRHSSPADVRTGNSKPWSFLGDPAPTRVREEISPRGLDLRLKKRWHLDLGRNFRDIRQGAVLLQAPGSPGSSGPGGLGQGRRVLPRGWLRPARLRPQRKEARSQPGPLPLATCVSALSAGIPAGWGQVGGFGKGLGSRERPWGLQPSAGSAPPIPEGEGAGYKASPFSSRARSPTRSIPNTRGRGGEGEVLASLAQRVSRARAGPAPGFLTPHPGWAGLAKRLSVAERAVRPSCS
ncbi:translation initiation factor IF-2-like [Fukomys damarensis]|uniref:translation initiation factor IF-2-like n=1 Tax=Fukomys damarensis TaxID=885580 RepID=UPI001455BB30|nr:translation initiation factor IF-2-like [Fukomys damarensis]